MMRVGWAEPASKKLQPSLQLARRMHHSWVMHGWTPGDSAKDAGKNAVEYREPRRPGRSASKRMFALEGRETMSTTMLIVLIVIALFVFGGGGFYWSRRGV